MIILLSPTKLMKGRPAPKGLRPTFPRFKDYSRSIAAKLARLPKSALQDLMPMSDDLARMNRARYRDFANEGAVAHPAVLSYSGAVYIGLNAEGFSEKEFDFAQKHLRILSGMYGYLRPLDKILPYRLEMQAGLPVRRKKNLYEFWRPLISEALAEDSRDSTAIINLASQEYARAVDRTRLKSHFINIHFRQIKNGKVRNPGPYEAKWMRGHLAGHMIKKRVKSTKSLKKYTEKDYRFDKDKSDENNFYFIQ